MNVLIQTTKSHVLPALAALTSAILAAIIIGFIADRLHIPSNAFSATVICGLVLAVGSFTYNKLHS